MLAEVDMVGVVVPAHNEESGIDRCLDAVHGACERCPVPTLTVVVLDSCTDSTAARVAGHPRVQVVALDATSVGATRRAGVDWVLSHTVAVPERTWLAHTDADSEPPPGWLSYMVNAAQGGADMILGTVVPDVDDSRLLRAWEALHPDETGHRSVHGANFGIRASVYLAAGGFPSVDTGEDVALAHRAATLARGTIVRTPAIPVLTSGRRVGRAPGGFASYLDRLATAG
jgi:glycosyltransferase involved in cell wall biosynthesis